MHVWIKLSWFCWEGFKNSHSRIFVNYFLSGAQFPIYNPTSPGLNLIKRTSYP